MSSGKSFESFPLNFSRLEKAAEAIDHSIKREFQRGSDKIHNSSTYYQV